MIDNRILYITKLGAAADNVDKLLHAPWSRMLDTNEFLQLNSTYQLLTGIMLREMSAIRPNTAAEDLPPAGVRSYPTMDE